MVRVEIILIAAPSTKQVIIIAAKKSIEITFVSGANRKSAKINCLKKVKTIYRSHDFSFQ